MPDENRIRYVWTDLFAIAAVFISISIIAIIHLQDFELTDRMYPQNHGETVSNPLYKSENMTVVIDMSARTFSTHEDIAISIYLYPNANERGTFYDDPEYRAINWSNVVYRIAFENTYCTDSHGRLGRCFFDLNWNQDQFAWVNQDKTIRYSVGGVHSIFLFNQTTNTDQFRQGILTSRVEEPFIQIDSISAINSLRTAEQSFDAWKSVVTIAIIAALVGALALYQRIRQTLLTRYGEYRL